MDKASDKFSISICNCKRALARHSKQVQRHTETHGSFSLQRNKLTDNEKFFWKNSKEPTFIFIQLLPPCTVKKQNPGMKNGCQSTHSAHKYGTLLYYLSFIFPSTQCKSSQYCQLFYTKSQTHCCLSRCSNGYYFCIGFD